MAKLASINGDEHFTQNGESVVEGVAVDDESEAKEGEAHVNPAVKRKNPMRNKGNDVREESSRAKYVASPRKVHRLRFLKQSIYPVRCLAWEPESTRLAVSRSEGNFLSK